MKIVSKIATTVALGFALPMALLGLGVLRTMEEIGDQAGAQAERVIAEAERARLADLTRTKALEIAGVLDLYRADVEHLRTAFAHIHADLGHCEPPPGADRYPADQTGGLPGYGRVHPKWGAYADFDRKGPGSPWVPRHALRAAEHDAAALRRLGEGLTEVMQLQPSLERTWKARSRTLDLVWVVLTSGVTNVHPPYDFSAILPKDPGIVDLDESGEDYVRLLAPDADPDRSVRWLEPYFDSFKAIWMTSCVAPLYAGETFLGTVGMDILLPTVADQVLTLDTGRGGFAFLMAPSGAPIAMSPQGAEALIADAALRATLQETFLPAADQSWTPAKNEALGSISLLRSPDAAIASLAARMARGERGTVELVLQGVPNVAAFDPVGTTGWSLGVVVPAEALAAPSRAVTATIGGGTERTIGEFITLAALLLALSVAVSFALHYLTVRPIMRLSRQVAAVSWSHMDLPPGTPTGDDEVGQLARRFTEVLRLLRTSRDDVTAQRRAQQTANRELEAANSSLTREIGERRSAEEALSREKEMISVTVASIADGVIATDMEGHIVLINRVACNMTAWSEHDATGQLLAQVYHVQDERTREPHADPVSRAMLGEALGSLTAGGILVARDGQQHMIAESVALIRSPRGDVRGVVLAFRDVSAKRRIEEEMQQVERLRSVSLLAAGIAHDFNNLLASVLGNLSIARVYTKDDARTARRLAEAESATLRARDLTTQLLTFSTGGAPVLQTLVLGDVVRDAASFAVRGARVRCEIEIAPRLWPVLADPGQISQVVSNLVLNADQAMGDGGVIRVGARNMSLSEAWGPLPPGRYVEVQVADDGPGIPSKDLPHIFDPFFTTKPQGSGLGLAVCFSVVQKHGGHIAVGTEGTGGTTFRVLLPAAAEIAAPSRDDTDDTPYGTGRVLLMDDEAAIREMGESMLELLGYEVVVTRDGAEAVEAFRRAADEGHPFDAVILDLTVPGGVGGLEASVQLRELDPNVRVVVSSGYSQDPVVAEHGAHGFAAALAKPYDVSLMARVLHRVIAGGRGAPVTADSDRGEA